MLRAPTIEPLRDLHSSVAGTLLTTGLIDRAIDRWETEYARSTVKNTIAVLVLVLDEAVRDGIVARNPLCVRLA
jgi:hypothetical protein